MSASNTLSVEVADAFQSAAITALQELTQIEAFPEQATSAVEFMPSGEVVLAAIRLLRPVPGTMTLVLPAETALQLAARYLPEGTQLSNEIIDDVAGEFANVIAGQAKTMLKGTPYHFTLTIPVVTRATDFVVPDQAPVTLLATEIGRVLVLVDLPMNAQV